MSSVQSQRPVGYELKRAENALRRAMEEALGRLGITVAQYATLRALEEAPGVSSAELARRSFVTPQTMHAVVRELEGRGLVERNPHAWHGRVLELKLTTDGNDLLAKARREVRRLERVMVSPLSAAEVRTLVAWLSRCADALEERNGGSG